MLVTTTDPITGNDVDNTEDAPFVIEGEGSGALKIYFESEQNKQEYLQIALESQGASVQHYNAIGDNEIMGTIN